MDLPRASTALSRIWIIGPGFLGSALAQSCRADGMDVLTIGPEQADVTGDASEPAVLKQALAQLEPELVYCCAATHGGGVEAYRRCYPELVRSVCAVVRARLVFCSSSSVYGGTDGSAADESSPCLASGERARVLLEAESLVQEAGGIVARLVPLYAEGRFELLRRHVAGEPRLAGGEERLLNYVHRDDAVAALRLMASLPGGTYNVSGDCFTLGEAYAMLESLTGIPRRAAQSAASCRGQSSRRVVADKLCANGWHPHGTVRDFVASQLGRLEQWR